MTTNYIVEVYNKYHDGFYEKIAEFNTYEEAERFVKNNNYNLDKDEYMEITENEYLD